MNRLLLAAGLCCCACGPTWAPVDRAAAAKSAILGGDLDSADPQVFQLRITGDNQAVSSCTATLIDLRTLLTAAHCVDPRTLGASSISLQATNLANAANAGPADYLPITQVRFHPQWNIATLDNDIGLAMLETVPVGVSPKVWNTQSVSTMSGLPLRALGYGLATAGGADSGLRREVGLTFRQVTAAKIFLGDQVGKGICSGDSGGPSFHTFPDGIERVVGVHSYTLASDCLDGADTRVDAQAAFIQAWIDEKEQPSCAEDGRCKLGCAPVDLDCVCGADGLCTTACPNLLKDPDCPRDCMPNGVCSVKPCPTPDVDCAPMGGGCTGPLQCVSRTCVSDAQHLPYCSRGCVTAADCPSRMDCDGTQVCRFRQLPLVGLGQACDPETSACGPGAVCTGRVAGATACAESCFDGRDCQPDWVCALSYDGQKFCAEKPKVILPLAHGEGPAAKGCAAAPIGLAAWLALAFWRPRAQLRKR